MLPYSYTKLQGLSGNCVLPTSKAATTAILAFSDSDLQWHAVHNDFYELVRCESHPWRGRKQVAPKHRQRLRSLHGTTTQKNDIIFQKHVYNTDLRKLNPGPDTQLNNIRPEEGTVPSKP
jgi:hypothetical protein